MKSRQDVMDIKKFFKSDLRNSLTMRKKKRKENNKNVHENAARLISFNLT